MLKKSQFKKFFHVYFKIMTDNENDIRKKYEDGKRIPINTTRSPSSKKLFLMDFFKRSQKYSNIPIYMLTF